MSDDRWQRICDLFERARTAPRSEREVLLAGDPEVRDEVEELLAQHERPDASLGTQVDLPPGSQLGVYRIASLLGVGGMGSVYLAEGPEGSVALKVLHPHLAGRDDFRERFTREATLGRRVIHDNVVRTLGVTDDGALVMEYVEGQTLDRLLQELGRVPEDLCRHIAHEVAGGLHAIGEQGIVHRDLKPENVLITPDHVVKVMDFGVAFPVDDLARLSQTGQFIGTIRYCAPEQIDGKGLTPDARADLYALGLVLYELATGQHPVPSGDVASSVRAQVAGNFRRLGEVNPQCSAFFEELVHTLLETSRDERIPSAAALIELLDEGEASDWWRERARDVERRTRRPLRRIRIPRDTAVYGRDGELARIASAFEAAAQGRGQVLLVEGEAGIGKTRLIDEAATQLRVAHPDAQLLFGSHPIGTASQGANALRAALADFLGRADLEVRLERILADTPALVPALAAFLRGDAPPADAEPLHGGGLQAALVAAVASISTNHPTILVLDDLHLASQEGLDLFAALAAAAVDLPLLLVGTMRPGVSTAWRSALERLDHSTVLELSRLGPKELTELLIDAFGSRRLAEQLGFRIAEKSDGNPFFVFEIVRALKEARQVVPTADGSWTTSGAILEIEVPASVREVIRARLDDLSEEEREILDVAACLGATFEPKLIAQALDQKLIPVLRALGRIERVKRLVRASGPTFVFDHHQVQETLYEQLSEPLREAYHAAIGDVLLARLGDRAPAGHDALELCQHLTLGTRHAAALDHLDGAYEQIWQRNLWDVGTNLFRRLLADHDEVTGVRRVEVLSHLRDCLEPQGRRAEIERVVEEAIAVAEATGEPMARGRAWTAWGWHQMYLGRLDEAIEGFERVIVAAKEAGYARGEASGVGNIGMVYSRQGNWPLALKQFRKYERRVTEIQDPYGISSALGNIGGLLAHLRRFEEAEDVFRRHIEICAEQSDDRGRCMSILALGQMYRLIGEDDRAEEYLARGLDLARQISDRLLEMRGLIRLGEVHAEAGAWDDGLALLEQGYLLAKENTDGEYMASVGVLLARLFRRRGDFDRAAVYLDEASGGDSVGGALRAAVQMQRARIAEARGQLDAARPHFREAEADAEHSPSLVCPIRVARGELALGARENETAREHFERAYALACETDEYAAQVAALCGLARCGEAERWDEAWDVFQRFRERMPTRDELYAACTLVRARASPEARDQFAALVDRYCELMSPETRALALVHDPVLREAGGAKGE